MTLLGGIHEIKLVFLYSESFLEVTSYMNHPEDLENLKEKSFPIKRYRVFTEYNSTK